MNKKIFFSTDVHGATSIWRKWLKVPEIYGVDALMLCGDLTGKVLVPLIKQQNGTIKTSYFGQNFTLTNEAEVIEMEKRIEDSGAYSIRCSKDELETFQLEPQVVEKIIMEKICNRMEIWLESLLKKIDPMQVQVVVMPGNDDDVEIDSIIKSFVSEGIIWCLDEVIEIVGVETISLAHTNHTPWDTPREATEKELKRKINGLTEKLKNPGESIFNFHCPPYNTRLDLAPKLSKKMKPVSGPNGIEYIHVGSKAVRTSIEKNQPILSLHGHIHESSGIEKIGKTVVINPGSEYGEGILRGYIIEFSNKALVNYYKVEG